MYEKPALRTAPARPRRSPPGPRSPHGPSGAAQHRLQQAQHATPLRWHAEQEEGRASSQLQSLRRGHEARSQPRLRDEINQPRQAVELADHPAPEEQRREHTSLPGPLLELLVVGLPGQRTVRGKWAEIASALEGWARVANLKPAPVSRELEEVAVVVLPAIHRVARLRDGPASAGNDVHLGLPVEGDQPQARCAAELSGEEIRIAEENAAGPA